MNPELAERLSLSKNNYYGFNPNNLRNLDPIVERINLNPEREATINIAYRSEEINSSRWFWQSVAKLGNLLRSVRAPIQVNFAKRVESKRFDFIPQEKLDEAKARIVSQLALGNTATLAIKPPLGISDPQILAGYLEQIKKANQELVALGYPDNLITLKPKNPKDKVLVANFKKARASNPYEAPEIASPSAETDYNSIANELRIPANTAQNRAIELARNHISSHLVLAVSGKATKPLRIQYENSVHREGIKEHLLEGAIYEFGERLVTSQIRFTKINPPRIQDELIRRARNIKDRAVQLVDSLFSLVKSF